MMSTSGLCKRLGRDMSPMANNKVRWADIHLPQMGYNRKNMSRQCKGHILSHLCSTRQGKSIGDMPKQRTQIREDSAGDISQEGQALLTMDVDKRFEGTENCTKAMKLK